MGNINIKGNNVSIINNKIFVDGKEIGTEEKEINIIVEGNLDKLEVDCCNSIKVNGVTKDVEYSMEELFTILLIILLRIK